MGHWLISPAIDPRQHLPEHVRGRLAPGHTTRDPSTCPGCTPAAAAATSALNARLRVALLCERPSTIDVDPSAHGRTTREVVLIAVADLVGGGFGSAATVDIVRRAWRLNPRAFGLRGHESEHPCSATVRAKLSTLRAAGWLAGAEPGRWSLTAAGRARLKEVTS